MALKEDQQILSLLYECVDAPIFQSRKNAIAAGTQRILGYVTPP